MKILIDLNLSPSWVQFFADRKIEAVHWSDLGSVSAPDSEILAYAAARNLIVFTHDLDFGALLAASKLNAPSVCRFALRMFCRPPSARCCCEFSKHADSNWNRVRL